MNMNSLLAPYEYGFMLGSCCIAFCLHSSLILKRIFFSNQIQNRMSFFLLTNILCWCCVCIAGILHSGYILWGYWMMIDEVGLYSGPALFWSGTAYFTGCSMVSVSVTCLILERIRALLWPTWKFKHFLNFSTIAIILCVAIFIVVSLIILELPVPNRSLCFSWSCIVSRNKGVSEIGTKSVLGLTNFVVAVIFAFLFYHHQTNVNASQKHIKQANFIALLAALTEFAFNLAPNIFFLFNSMNGVPQWEIFGPYVAALSAMDALCAACIYKSVIVKKPTGNLATALVKTCVFKGRNGRVCMIGSVSVVKNVNCK